MTVTTPALAGLGMAGITVPALIPRRAWSPGSGVPARQYADHGLPPPSTVRRRRATTAGSPRARWARGDGREWRARLAARAGASCWACRYRSAVQVCAR